MEVKLQPGQKLSDLQKGELKKCFDFMAGLERDAKQRAKSGKPPLVAKSELPKLLRACGRSPPQEEMDELLKRVPDTGLEVQGFFKLFEVAAEKPGPTESQLLAALQALDLSGSGTLDPKQIRDLVSAFGSRMPSTDIETVLAGLPTDRTGRVGCRAIASLLFKGPDDIPHFAD
mmetsp:Transcript_32143/g.84895  ORF Transcript_32143/g.84895 Transcript_32143/m.84895 type:complete len:174 (+) Transcript_32143:86-607(+)